MPLAFAAIPGLAGPGLIAARGPHDVTATGPSTTLSTMVPQFRAVAGAVANSFLFQFYQIYWLLLAIIRPAAAFPRGALLVASMIHVQRLGVAFEACIAGGLDCSPCSASVARKRLRRLSAQLFLTAPAPFEALAADVYALAMPPPPAPGRLR